MMDSLFVVLSRLFFGVLGDLFVLEKGDDGSWILLSCFWGSFCCSGEEDDSSAALDSKLLIGIWVCFGGDLIDFRATGVVAGDGKCSSNEEEEDPEDMDAEAGAATSSLSIRSSPSINGLRPSSFLSTNPRYDKPFKAVNELRNMMMLLLDKIVSCWKSDHTVRTFLAFCPWHHHESVLFGIF